MLSGNNIIWNKGVAKHQPGTINVNGIIALGEAMRIMEKIGWDRIMIHESKLTHQMALGLDGIKGVKLYVNPEKYSGNAANRTGAITFSVRGLHHALVSAILGNEHAIETRSGTICNHRLVNRWFNITDKEQAEIESKMRSGNLLASYGIVRASLGVYNTEEEVDMFLGAVSQIARSGPRLHYLPVE